MLEEKISNIEALRDPDKKMSEDFKNFIEENNFTTEQVEEAYGKLCGISESDDPVVDQIYKKMEEMSENKYSISNFPKIIETKRNHENAVPDYLDFIESLDISKREKIALSSIVEKKRKGELELLVDQHILFSIRVVKTDEPEEMAMELKDFINKRINKIPPGKKYGFNFSED